MISAKSLMTFAVVAVAITRSSFATPFVPNLTARQISPSVPGFPERYPMVCNKLVLPTTEIESCANDLVANAKGTLKIGGNSGYIHLCDRPHVYVQGRAWGEQGAEADAIAVGNAVKWILWTCGNKGGSMSVNGDQGAKSFIVHVSDQWT